MATDIWNFGFFATCTHLFHRDHSVLFTFGQSNNERIGVIYHFVYINKAGELFLNVCNKLLLSLIRVSKHNVMFSGPPQETIVLLLEFTKHLVG